MIMLFGNAYELTAAAKLFMNSLEEMMNEVDAIDQETLEEKYNHIYHTAQKLCFVNKHALSFAFLGELESVASWDYKNPVYYHVTERGVMLTTAKGSFEIWSPALSVKDFEFITPLRSSTERPLRLS